MSAQLIEFPNPAMPDAAQVREHLAWLRPQLETPLPDDEFCAAFRVIRELRRRGKDPEQISMTTLLAELRREKEADEWLPADVIEFPTEIWEEPLRSLRAVWRHTTARAEWYRALKADEPLPDSVSRRMANAYGDEMRKPGKRQAEQLLAEIGVAEAFIRSHSRGLQDDESMETFITMREIHGPVSRGLQLIGRAVRARTGGRASRSIRRADGPEAA